MKSLLLIVAAVLAAGFGIALLVMTKASTIGIIAASFFVLFALACMAPVTLHTMREELTAGYKSWRNPQGGTS